MRNLVSVALALCAGCSTVTRNIDCSKVRVDGGVPIEVVEASNSNWMLLTCIPIASGDPEDPNNNSICWFDDRVHLSGQMRMLEDEARRVGATRAVDVRTSVTDEEMLFFLFLREKVHTSAVLIKD